jgi:hypothetical protein
MDIGPTIDNSRSELYLKLSYSRFGQRSGDPIDCQGIFTIDKPSIAKQELDVLDVADSICAVFADRCTKASHDHAPCLC